MANLWEQSGVPHKGWECIDVIDLREDADTDDPTTNYEICQMCGQENIRYAHIMRHDKYPDELLVGCVCAGHMTDDYEGARERENRVRNRSRRRVNWLKRKWRTTTNGNIKLAADGHSFLVFRDRYRSNRWKFKFDDTWSQRSYPSQREAMLALFDFSYKLIEEEKEAEARRKEVRWPFGW